MNQKTVFHSYFVWDKNVRIFHWLNVICILALTALGIVLLYAKNLGVSLEGKIALKTIHVYIGYLFTINLLWRMIWGFLGSYHAKWKSILPFTKGYLSSLRLYFQTVKQGNVPAYIGHSPIAKLIISLMFLLLIAQTTTGLVLAGTDLYFPPFGDKIAKWVALSDEQEVKAGSKEGVNLEAYKEMRAFRKPFIETHKVCFYILMLMIFIHVFAIVFLEIKEKCGLVSAMITGSKVFSKQPIDLKRDKE